MKISAHACQKMANKTGTGGPGSITPRAVGRIEEDIRGYVDVGTITDTTTLPEPEEIPAAGPSSSKGPPVSIPDEPPAYTKIPDALSEAEVLLHAHPRGTGVDDDLDEDYASLIDALGLRCTVFEAELKKRSLVNAPGRGKLTIWLEDGARAQT
jgi:hypothetical protein